MLGCRECTHLEALVLALARRLHDAERRLRALERARPRAEGDAPHPPWTERSAQAPGFGTARDR